MKRLPPPAVGNKITFDDDVHMFGVRVTAAGSRAFVLQYRNRSGQLRRYTIGTFPEWATAAARNEARKLKAAIRANGHDPVGEFAAQRSEPTIANMIDRYIDEHLPKKRPASQAEDHGMIEQWLRGGALPRKRVAEVRYADIDALHRKITLTGTPIRANRVVALLSKMFSLAIRWQWIQHNPGAGIERNQEQARERYLTGDEWERLTRALADYPDRQAANIIRFLLLTGARKGETLRARWADFDLDAGVWTKPGATTKQKTVHRVPLSAPARQLLVGLERESEYVFPGKGGSGHRVDLKRPWPAIRKAAGLEGVRVHDLRHSYASVLASSGQSLLVIGKLLGHTQAATTLRYAHLVDDPLRRATETAGAFLAKAPVADVVAAPRGGRR